MKFQDAANLSNVIDATGTPWEAHEVAVADFDSATAPEAELFRAYRVTEAAPFFLLVRKQVEGIEVPAIRPVYSERHWAAIGKAEARAEAAREAARVKAEAAKQREREKKLAARQAARDKAEAARIAAREKAKGGKKTTKAGKPGGARAGNANGHSTDFPGGVPAGAVPLPGMEDYAPDTGPGAPPAAQKALDDVLAVFTE